MKKQKHQKPQKHQNGKSSSMPKEGGMFSSSGAAARIPGVKVCGVTPVTTNARGSAGQTLKHPPHPTQYAESNTGAVKASFPPSGSMRSAWVGQTSAQAPQD
jgi:hypothetical protein